MCFHAPRGCKHKRLHTCTARMGGFGLEHKEDGLRFKLVTEQNAIGLSRSYKFIDQTEFCTGRRCYATGINVQFRV